MLKDMISTEQRGFTLIEVLTSIVVVAIAVGAVIQFISILREGNELSRREAAAVLAVENKVESLRNTPFASLTSGSFGPTEIPDELIDGSGTYTITNLDTYIKQVDLTITYKLRDKTNTFEFRTYIGEPGVTK